MVCVLFVGLVLIVLFINSVVTFVLYDVIFLWVCLTRVCGICLFIWFVTGVYLVFACGFFGVCCSCFDLLLGFFRCL